MKKWTKALIGNIELNKDLKLLLIIGGLYALGIALSNTFVNVYIWKQSGEFIDIATYNLAAVILQPITFLLAGRLAKGLDRVIILRIGVSFLSVFYCTVLLLGENAGSYLLILGGLLGIGMGFYWLSFNVLTFEITEPDTRDFFNGFLGLLTSFAGMVGPFSAGILITKIDEVIGYRTIFAVSLGLFITAVVLSFFLEKRISKGSFRFLDILRERKHNRDWSRILFGQFFQGFREGTFIFVITVWIYVATGSEMALGTYGLIVSAVSFVVYYLAGRFIKPSFRKKSILIGGLGLYGAIFFIVNDLTFTRLILYGITISISYPLLLVPFVSLTYDVIGSGRDAKERRVEYIVVRQIFLDIGRLVSVLSFIATITFFSEEKGIPILLLVLGLGHFIIYLFVRKVQSSVTNEHDAYSAVKKRW
ncbi:MFS transporter [Texcoconibacillus texcoconensis]|uniref:YQGE family putative transporter n=1 Tax=Texcoconibacillus texcoconensis TaxID=1095777 RepID=A0A840QRA6_9BACI|nr:MFS transporter [Texcoconibacillus texcoconensis]MBB5173895.1 YQGE family putative transporter [Texcoconibacillus texcoconensis]